MSLQLESPFEEMLEALAGVRGYQAFEDFVRGRMNKSSDWKAEIKALYEVHKPQHPLIDISSAEEGAAEGTFKCTRGTGIVEAAFIRYRFDTNDKARKALNRVLNSPLPVGKTIEVPELGLTVTSKEGGTIATGYDVDIVLKAKTLLKTKRAQHKGKPPDWIRLYYVYVDCPPSKLRRISAELEQRLSGLLKANELFVACACGVSRGAYQRGEAHDELIHMG